MTTLTLTRRAITAWQSTNLWLVRRPHVMALILLGFGSLFGAYCVFDFATGNVEGAKLAAVCMALAGIAGAYESIRLMRKRIAAGQGGAQ